MNAQLNEAYRRIMTLGQEHAARRNPDDYGLDDEDMYELAILDALDAILDVIAGRNRTASELAELRSTLEASPEP